MSLAAGGGHRTMSNVTCQISVSLDGFVAGPNQSLENPLGEGGERLHEWAFATASWREQHGKPGGEHTADAEVADAMMRGVGAFVMGRKMFGGGDGPWDEGGRGCWTASAIRCCSPSRWSPRRRSRTSGFASGGSLGRGCTVRSPS